MLQKTLLGAAMALCFATPAVAIEDAAVQDIFARIGKVGPSLVAWYRDIHEHPELSGQETRTAALVAAHLKKLGMEVTTGVGGAGVVGVLKGGKPGKVVALRADMDALPVKELTGLPYASKAKGVSMGQTVDVMHACGHDGHTAILMAVAEVLSGMKDQLAGSVKFIFQPSEEGHSKTPVDSNMHIGALAMIDAGVMDNPKVDAIFGLHLVAGAPAGIVGYRSGPIMAAGDNFMIKVTGRQTHGAFPWAGVDPVVVSAQIVTGLQTIVSRQIDLTNEPAVVTIGTIHGGNRENIVPEMVEMTGTVRSFDDSMRDDIFKRIRLTAESIALASGAKAELSMGLEHYSATVNPAPLTQKMLPALTKAAAGKIGPAPKIGAYEDFSEFQKKVPGMFFFVGAVAAGKNPMKAPPNHSPLFQVDESALPVGVRALAVLAVEFLASP